MHSPLWLSSSVNDKWVTSFWLIDLVLCVCLLTGNHWLLFPVCFCMEMKFASSYQPGSCGTGMVRDHQDFSGGFVFMQWKQKYIFILLFFCNSRLNHGLFLAVRVSREKKTVDMVIFPRFWTMFRAFTFSHLQHLPWLRSWLLETHFLTSISIFPTSKI